jgi:hypothetical protein
MRDGGNIDEEFERPTSVGRQSTQGLAAGAMMLLAVFAANGRGQLLMFGLALLGAATGWLVADLVGDLQSIPLTIAGTPGERLQIDGVTHSVDDHPAVIIEEQVRTSGTASDRNKYNQFMLSWEPNRPPELDGPAPADPEVTAEGMVETVTLAERVDSPGDAYSFGRRVARTTEADLVWTRREGTDRWALDELDVPLVDRLSPTDVPDWGDLETETDGLDIQPETDGGVTLEWPGNYPNIRRLLGLGLAIGFVMGLVVASEREGQWFTGMLLGMGLIFGMLAVPAAILFFAQRRRGHRVEIGPDGIRKHHHLYGIVPTVEEIEPADIHHLRVEHRLDDGLQLEAFGDDLYTILGRRADVDDLPLRDVALCGLLGCAGGDDRNSAPHHW